MFHFSLHCFFYKQRFFNELSLKCHFSVAYNINTVSDQDTLFFVYLPPNLRLGLFAQVM